MKTGKIILTSIVATSCMTLFSYLLSAIMKEDFREPYFLDEIIQAEFPLHAGKIAFWEGWIIHYCVGVIFMGIFAVIWRTQGIYPNTKSGALLGAASGLIAVLCWVMVLNLYPNLTQANRTHYYVQLIVAHVIFGTCAARVYVAIQSPFDRLKP